MTRRRLFLPNIRGMTIGAVARLLELPKLVFNRNDLRVRGLLAVLVAGRARRYRNVGCQSAQRACPGDVDVTGGALLNVIFFSTFVTEHRGFAWRQIDANESSGRFVTTATVVAGRLQILPVAIEAGVVRMRHGLVVSIWHRIPCSRGNQRNRFPAVIRLVTDRTVVVVEFRLIVRAREGSLDKARLALPSPGSQERRDHVLMFVVRELDSELPFVLRLRRLISIVRLAESEAPIFAWRGTHMTDGANCRASAGESLSREELLPVAANAGIVIGKVCRVGKTSLRRPRSRQLVTRVAREALVLVG